ncbi:MAG: hypothetical protein LBM77_12870 [Spirochaetaceae bacterium]|jgi:tetratricopeptide (TPR) repeat protein|nr:hypothetical protein [Spirochaetaceae bacterium]
MQAKIDELLQANGLADYISLFNSKGFTDSEEKLTQLTESDFEDFGIKVMGDRKKLLKVFSVYKDEYLKISTEKKRKKGIKLAITVSAIVLVALSGFLGGYYGIYPYILLKDGNEYMANKQYANAIDSYTKYLNIKEDVDVRLNKVYSYYKVEQISSAVNEIKHILQIYPFSKVNFNQYNKSGEFDYLIACAYLSLGNINTTLDYSSDNYNKAINYYTLSINNKINLLKSYYYRAVTYYNMNNWSRTLNDLNEVLNIDPNYSDAILLAKNITTNGSTIITNLFAKTYFYTMSSYNEQTVAISGTVDSVGIDRGSATLGGAIVGGLIFGPLGTLLGAGLGANPNYDPSVIKVSGVNCYFDSKAGYFGVYEDQPISIVGNCKDGNLYNCYVYKPITINYNW